MTSFCFPITTTYVLVKYKFVLNYSLFYVFFFLFVCYNCEFLEVLLILDWTSNGYSCSMICSGDTVFSFCFL